MFHLFGYKSEKIFPSILQCEVQIIIWKDYSEYIITGVKSCFLEERTFQLLQHKRHKPDKISFFFFFFFFYKVTYHQGYLNAFCKKERFYHASFLYTKPSGTKSNRTLGLFEICQLISN